MLLIKYLILGIIQGFTEPLPISSSGHLKLFKCLINSNVLNDLNFEIIVNFGSLVGIIILYKNEIFNIIKEFILYIKTRKKVYKTNYNYGLYIIIGTIPAALFGFLFKDLIEKYFDIKVIGLMFIITSILIYAIKDIKGKKLKRDMTYIDAFKIGLFQALALIPGISRSGMTIVGGMKSNLTKETAFNYSFMLYIPVSIAAFIFGIKDLLNTININLVIPYIVSMIISSITTYYSTKLFSNIIKKGKLIYFSIYCFLLGFLIVILF